MIVNEFFMILNEFFMILNEFSIKSKSEYLQNMFEKKSSDF